MLCIRQTISYLSLRSLHRASLCCQSIRAEEKTTNLYDDVIPKIGLEVHAQLKINSKLFSSGGNSKCDRPNSQLDLFDVSLPGTLPTLNREALKLAILSSLGLNCTIQDEIHFDRKNYFYTDMPAGYQITQYNKPIARDGFIDFVATTYHNSVIAHSQRYDLTKEVYFDERKSLEEFEPYIKRSQIKQIQLEQDSAKTFHHYSSDTHQELYSLVDYNRSGCGLIEIVFEPDLTSHHEASSLIKELVIVLKKLGTCDCELEEGSLRVDANVSIESISGNKAINAGRVELKNLNSIRSVNRGIAFEIDRQAALLREGGKVLQESRTYDTKAHRTVILRQKEDAIDYRYVPEPNIPLLRLNKKIIEEATKALPSDLPTRLRESLLSKYDLDLLNIAELLEEPDLSNYMLSIMDAGNNYDANSIADFLIYTIANLKRIPDAPTHVDLSGESEFMFRLDPSKIQKVLDLVVDDTINLTIGFRLIKHIFVTGDLSDPHDIVKVHDWHQINEPARIAELCKTAIENMKGVSKKYSKKGEKRHLRVLLEKVCEISDDKINVKMAIQSLNDQLRHSQ